jgi:hypothetical protein
MERQILAFSMAYHSQTLQSHALICNAFFGNSQTYSARIIAKHCYARRQAAGVFSQYSSTLNQAHLMSKEPKARDAPRECERGDRQLRNGLVVRASGF